MIVIKEKNTDANAITIISVIPPFSPFINYSKSIITSPLKIQLVLKVKVWKLLLDGGIRFPIVLRLVKFN